MNLVGTMIINDLGSILLGLIAWIVPILSMKRSVKYGLKYVIVDGRQEYKRLV